MTRVLHLLRTGPVGSWAWRQVAVLRAAGVEVVVAVPGARSGMVAAFRRAGATVVEADLDWSTVEPWRIAGAMRRCREVVAQVRPDVIHTHFAGTTLVARLALGRAHPIPRVFQVRNPRHLEHPALRRLELAASGPRDVWIATSRGVQREYLTAGAPPDRVFLSYYGTDLERFAAAAPGSFRASLGVANATALIGVVAHMRAPQRLLGQSRSVKGHEDFIDAMRRVTRARPNAVGVVVGSAWEGAKRYESQLRAKAREACGNAIRFVGTRDDVPVVYRDLDLAVHPYRADCGWGAVESLAAGCPTVGTDVGGLRDAVIQGHTGWVVRPGDPERLASAILQALGDPEEARRRARLGQELVQDLFDVERTGREVAAIYRRLLGIAPQPAAQPDPMALAG